MGGLIGKLLSFVRAERNGAQVSDVKNDPGGGPVITAEHFGAPGDDGHPLPADYVYQAPTPQRGRYAALGYVDPLNAPKATAGERRLYSRDPQTREYVAEVWLKSDGEIEIINDLAVLVVRADGSIRGSNSAGYFELESGGDFVANGAKMTTDGDVQTSDGVSLRGHPHNQGPDSDGNTQAATDPPTATV